MKMMDYGDLECGQSSVGGTSSEKITRIMFHNHGFMIDYQIPYVVQRRHSIKKRLSKHRLKISAFRYYC